MSFTRYNTEDSVVSSEAVVRGMWTNDALILTTFFTSSNQTAETLKYFLNTYDTTATSSLQFAIQYGHVSGSGSVYINPIVTGSTPSRNIYGQYRNLIYGDENTNFSFNGTYVPDIFIVNIARSRYKESIRPASLNLILSGSSGKLYLTDNSNDVTSPYFVGSNIYYHIVSGSSGTGVSGSITYGYIFPDLGTLILDPTSLGSGYVTTPTRTANTDGSNHKKLFDSIKLGSSFSLQSEETVSSRYFFTRVKNGEYNYTTNPSIIDTSGNILYSTLINSPQTYVTTVGLYNDNNELLAVAKLSRPLVKDFTKESLLRIKLDY